MEHVHEYLSLLTDPAHWAFELTLQMIVDGILFTVVAPRAMKWWHERHDRDNH